MKIIYKTKQEIALLKECGKIHDKLLLLLYERADVGVSLMDLENLSSDFLTSHLCKSAFKWFHGFPANLCLSVNDCLVHWIPDDYILKKGDLLKIDVWIKYKWVITDAAVSKVIGGDSANKIAAELLRVTKESLDYSLNYIKPWVSLYEYWKFVWGYIKDKWFVVVKSLTGHGVGKNVHEDPRVANYADVRLRNVFFKPWMVLALEPITSEISDDYITHPNKRNLITKKWDLGCQWEYTVVVTDDGYEIIAGISQI